MQHSSEPVGWHSLQSISDSPMQRCYALSEPNLDINSVVVMNISSKIFCDIVFGGSRLHFLNSGVDCREFKL